MIEITHKPISPELVVNKVKTYSSRLCRYLRRLDSRILPGKAEERLREIAGEAGQKWQPNNIAICHRIGKLKVGDINLVVAVAAAHRREGFAACQYAIDLFKQKLSTRKKETYQDSSTWVEERD